MNVLKPIFGLFRHFYPYRSDPNFDIIEISSLSMKLNQKTERGFKNR